MYSILFFFFKQKTAYEMRISDWSSDVCSSDLFPTCGMITVVWLFMQAWWVKQLDTTNRAIWYFAAYLGISYLIGIPIAVMAQFIEEVTPSDAQAEIGRASGRERVSQ